MPGENIQDWSVTANVNGSADTLINWQEGQPRASVNNSARSMMAALAKDRNLRNGSIVTSGTANAQTFTSGVSYTTIPTGLRVLLKIGVDLTNTAATTINMDGIGDVAVKSENGADITAGMLTANTYVELSYDGTNWILLGSGDIVVNNTTTNNLTVNGNQTVTGTLIAASASVTGALTAGSVSTGTGGFINSGYLRATGPGWGLSGYSGALSISATGDGTLIGIVIRTMINDGYIQLFTNNPDGVMGGIYNNGGAETIFATTSDGAMKTDIEDLPSAGNTIDRLRPVKFKWRDNPKAGERSGFVAQDVYSLVPQAVVPGREGVPWMMDPAKLVPLLVAELQSLRARVADLEKR